MGARWELRNPLVLGRDAGSEGEVSGPDGAYFDFSDSQNWTADEQAAIERLLAEANAAEVYRKALEPFAREFARGYAAVSRINGFAPHFLCVEVRAEGEAVAAAVEAARLMGLLPLAEEVPSERTASADEAFEGKGAKE